MNITIDVNNSSNTNFSSRYLKLCNEEKMPQIIKDAIYKSTAIDEFIHQKHKKGFIGRLLDLFKRDEVLEIEYVKSSQDSFINEHKNDPYEKRASLYFKFGKEGEKNYSKNRYFTIIEQQNGVYHYKPGNGRILKPGENPFYDEPSINTDEKIAKRIERIRNLDTELQKIIKFKD